MHRGLMISLHGCHLRLLATVENSQMALIVHLIIRALKSNNFTRKIPPSLGKLSKIYWLDLADNQLTDNTCLPLSLWSKEQCVKSNTPFIFLSSSTPKFFSSEMILIHILFDGNNLSGTIPSTLVQVKTVEVLCVTSRCTWPWLQLATARVDRIQTDLDEVVKSLNERCKKYGLRAKPTTLLELPFGWQPGIQEGAADWDEDWDKLEDKVVIRNHPELLDQPVAVSHSNNSNGTAEISYANYPACSHGIRAGMFVRNAKALCPQLVIFPYNFEANEEVADQFYRIFHQHFNKVQAVSCDEAFLDVTDLEVEDTKLLASSIREEMYKTTGCITSAGIAGNMLMVRIATRTAKPNGQ
ncbi:hypothetical protein V8G54_006563 [Vigna mungo]|uniref:UmuC domain-containing protein n=1 Tax=Vigna mungo TaxID=3915 RepID=A0AAQ3NZ82_VIGMU